MRHRAIAAIALAAALAAGSAVAAWNTTPATAAPAAAPVMAPAAQTAGADLRSTITVLGDGRVTVVPDLATVTFGVEATAQTLAAAQADAATRMQAVIDALTGMGIAKEDIRTSRVSTSPIYDERDRTQVRGYQATNSVQVELRELDKVGQIVDAITAAGANRVDGIGFTVENIEEPKNQARALAVQHARAKADQLAGLVGMRVVGVKSIQESDGSSRPVTAQPMAARAEAAASTPVEPGTQEIRTQVTITYIIEQ